jgi:choline dehydrogenase-like flavoprotein
MNDASFAADAATGFNETPSRGPYTLALANSAAYISLPHLAPTTHSSITTKILALATNTTLAASYLPPDHRTSTPMIAGYQAQLTALATLLSNPDSPSLESPFWTGASASAILLHPLSRGTVRLDPADHLAQPILDSRAATNPVDFDLHLAHVRFLRRAGQTETLKRYGAVEVAPGGGVDDGDDEALRAWVRRAASLSFNHPCCTAAMMPEEKGGVVGTDLKVHGAGGRLRVVDISVLPLVPGTHLMATAYAVGERAADLIIQEWK